MWDLQYSILICVGALVCLLFLLRADKLSLGLPLAYLYLLLFNHVPGAWAHWVGSDILAQTVEETKIGISFTAIGSIFFVTGVWLAQRQINKIPIRHNLSHESFSKFCLLGGWFFVYGLSSLTAIPSLGAAIEKGGAVWMLGVMLGLREAVQRSNVINIMLWAGALMVYPILMLLLGGFASYGTAAIIIVSAILAVSTGRTSRILVVGSLVTFLGVSLFTNYFAHRGDIRESVWGGQAMGRRIDAVLGMFSDFSWLNPTDQDQLEAMHARLNQNYFAGLAAERIEFGEVNYLFGRSVWEGLQALVPRAIWPDKPVVAGSPKIVAEMTGLELSKDTSWGVGQVMEFQINFGIPGLVIGFGLLGWLLGTLDRKAAELERNGDLGRLFLYFVPAVALIEPVGSIVELSGGAASGLVAAFGWRWAWNRWSRRRAQSYDASRQQHLRLAERIARLQHSDPVRRTDS
jgi:hypothetical protein